MHIFIVIQPMFGIFRSICCCFGLQLPLGITNVCESYVLDPLVNYAVEL